MSWNSLRAAWGVLRWSVLIMICLQSECGCKAVIANDDFRSQAFAGKPQEDEPTSY